MRSSKGAAHERWAKVYNLKQMAAALQFMQEHPITEYEQLTIETGKAVFNFHTLTDHLRQTEADLSHISELMAAVVQYAKTRPIFDGYKAAKYSRNFLAEHEAELADYRAAKDQIRQAVAVKANIDHLLGVTDDRRKDQATSRHSA